MWGSNGIEIMSSNRRLPKSGVARFAGGPSYYYLSRWEGHSNIIVVTEGLRRASRFSTMSGFPSMTGVWGPNRARITSNRRDYLSHLFFTDTQLSRCFRPTTPGELMKTPQTVSYDAKWELCIPGKKCLISTSWGCSLALQFVDFERGPLMTLGHATLHSLLWVALFGEAETISTDHSLVGVFPYFHTRQSSFRYP